MLGSFATKGIAMLLVTVVGTGAAYAGWRHYTGLLTKAEQDRIEIDALTREAEAHLRSIDELQAAHRDAQEARVAALEATRELERLYANHNLEKLARRKPGLIERRANAATAELARLFTCTTDPSCDAAGGDKAPTTAAP